MMEREITIDRNKQLIGSGGYATVFHGTFQGSPVAVKRIEHHRRCNDKEETALGILKHPNIVKLHKIEDSEDFRFYAFELCAGSLDQLFLSEDDPHKYRGPPLPRHIKVLLQLAEGLAYIHSKGLVHRDIKPANVLISISSKEPTTATLKWADFGLTKETSECGTYEMSGQRGTLYWMAPEILAYFNRKGPSGPNKFTPLTDVFSAGCLFFSMVTDGIHPFGNNIYTDVPSNIESSNAINFMDESILQESHFARDIIGGMLKPKAPDRLTVEEVIRCIRKKMEEEMYRKCTIKDPTDIDLDQLIELLNDEDCPHLIRLENHNFEYNYEDIYTYKYYTPIELLCKTNHGRKLKQLIEVELLKNEKKNGPARQLNGTRALDFVCEYYNQHDDLLDIVRLLIERTQIDFNRPGLKLREILENGLKSDFLYELLEKTNNQYLNVIKTMIEEPLFFANLDEYDINKPEFRIRHLFEKYLNALKRGPPFLNYHTAAATKTLCELHATIEEKAMLRILPRLEPYLKENVPNLVQHLENLIEDLQLIFDRRRNYFYQTDIQISNLFKSLFFNNRKDIREKYNCQLIELLIESGLNINARDYEHEMNALHLLFFYCSEGINALEVTKMPNEKGADINAKLINPNYALNDSCNKLEVAKRLIEKGIDVNAIVKSVGMNALHFLCEYYRGEHLMEIGKILLDNGVNINALDHQGWNAIICLCNNHKSSETVEMLKFLIESGSDARVKDTWGQTGLHYLCSPCRLKESEKRFEMTRLLLNKGVDINATGLKGQTALHCLLDGYLREDRGKELVEFLIENGIDVNAKDNEGNDACYYLKNNYKKYNKNEIEKIILNHIDCNNIPVAKKLKIT